MYDFIMSLCLQVETEQKRGKRRTSVKKGQGNPALRKQSKPIATPQVQNRIGTRTRSQNKSKETPVSSSPVPFDPGLVEPLSETNLPTSVPISPKKQAERQLSIGKLVSVG